jgi:hypothetical protein
MESQDSEDARDDDRNEELEDSPVPDAEGENTEDEDTAAI